MKLLSKLHYIGAGISVCEHIVGASGILSPHLGWKRCFVLETYKAIHFWDMLSSVSQNVGLRTK